MPTSVTDPYRPLADRLRPQNLDEFVGQQHLLGPGKPLRLAIENSRLHSMVLWGPPGTGKTTLARLLAHTAGAEFATLSAVLAGVKDIRAAVDKARTQRKPMAARPCCSSTRCIASTNRSRMRFCRTSRTAR